MQATEVSIGILRAKDALRMTVHACRAASVDSAVANDGLGEASTRSFAALRMTKLEAALAEQPKCSPLLEGVMHATECR